MKNMKSYALVEGEGDGGITQSRTRLVTGQITARRA